MVEGVPRGDEGALTVEGVLPDRLSFRPWPSQGHGCTGDRALSSVSQAKLLSLKSNGTEESPELYPALALLTGWSGAQH